MLRVVLDTNVLISGLMAPGGVSGQIREAWRKGRFTVCLSASMHEELGEVIGRPHIRRKLKLSPDEIREILALIKVAANFIDDDLEILPVIARDPDDDVVLATAVAAGADLIVSGDDDLLALERYKGMEIISPREFVDILRSVAP